MNLAFLIALANSLWCLAHVPVALLVEILPFGVIIVFKSSTSL